MTDRRSWYEPYEDARARAPRAHWHPGGVRCGRCYPQAVAPEPIQPIAPTPKGIVGATLSILRNITKGAAL